MELDKAGGFGFYQFMVCIIINVGMMSGGFVIHGIAYLELAPNRYFLPDGTSVTPEEFCLQKDPIYKYDSIDYNYVEPDGEPTTNIYNWYTKLGLVCNPKSGFAMGMIAFSALLGISLSCLFIPRLGDLYGRKPVFMVALTAQLPVYILLCLFNNMIPMYVSAFFLGPTVTGRMACGFLLLLEMVPKRNQAWTGASLMIAEGSTQIIWTVYFVWISKNAFWFIYGVLILNFFCILACFYVTESPRYLFGMERYDECKKVLITIAKRNGVKDYQEPEFNEETLLMVENADDLTDDLVNRINPSNGPMSPVGSEDNDGTERAGTKLF